MKVVVQAEASFIPAVFRFKSLISLSTRPLSCILYPVLQNCPNVTWHAELAANARIDDIKLKFCEQHGLSPGTCVLFSKGAVLKDQP